MIDYSNAFLKVPREVLEIIGADANAIAVYLTILGRVRWEAPIRINTPRGVVDLDIGQCVMGRDELAAAVGITVRSARTAVSALVDLGIIAQQTTNRGTTVTLVGFKESSAAQQGERPANRPTSAQQTTTTKKEDQSPDLSSLDLPEPIHGGRRDRDQGLGPRFGPKAADLCTPGDGAAFTELLTELQRGGTNLVLLKGRGGDS